MCFRVYTLLAELFTFGHSSRAKIHASKHVFLNYDVSKLFNQKIQSSLVLEGNCSEILNYKC